MNTVGRSQDPGTEVDEVRWSVEFEAILRESLPYLDADAPLRANQDLSALGLDSMMTINLLLAVETRLDVEIPDDELVPEMFASPLALWSRVRAALDRPSASRPVEHEE